MGDFNARTSLLNDYLFFEDILIRNTGAEEITYNLEKLNLCQRFNLDKNTVNTNGNCLLSLCKNFNFSIINGRFGKDKGVGDYTCYKSTPGSVIDYILVSDSVLPNVTDFSIGNFDKTLSDVHCPLFLEIKHNAPEPVITQNFPKVKTQKPNTFIHKWKTDINSEFTNAFPDEKIQSLNSLLENFSNLPTISQENVDSLASDFSNLFLETAKNVGLCKVPPKTPRKYTRIFPNKPWFNKNCNTFRRNYLQLKNRRGKKWSDAKDATYKEYQKVLYVRKKEFKKETENKLRSKKNRDPREYWNIIQNATNCGKKENKDFALSKPMNADVKQ